MTFCLSLSLFKAMIGALYINVQIRAMLIAKQSKNLWYSYYSIKSEISFTVDCQIHGIRKVIACQHVA